MRNMAEDPLSLSESPSHQKNITMYVTTVTIIYYFALCSVKKANLVERAKSLYISKRNL